MRKLFLSILAGTLLLANLAAQNQNQKNQSVVYFTKDVSSAGLLKVYNALNQKIEGKTGIKVSFGGPDEQVLDAKLLSGLVQKTNGTMLSRSNNAQLTF